MGPKSFIESGRRRTPQRNACAGARGDSRCTELQVCKSRVASLGLLALGVGGAVDLGPGPTSPGGQLCNLQD